MTDLHEGFWLGCLNADDLNALTAKHFDNSNFYASTKHNLSGFFNWETNIIESHFQPGSRIMVAMAGAGREVLALRKAGFEAEGFECSLALVQAGHEIFDRTGESQYVIHCPPDNVPLGAPIYDGMIVGWTGYTHIPTKLRRITFLQGLRARALPHSPVLLSFFTRNVDSRDETVVYRMASFCRFFLRTRDERIQVGDHLNFGRYAHSFVRDELEEELRAADFRVVRYSEEGGWGYAVAVAE